MKSMFLKNIDLNENIKIDDVNVEVSETVIEILILDHNTSHNHKEVLHYFHEFYTEVDFLPPSSMGSLQLMDVLSIKYSRKG